MCSTCLMFFCYQAYAVGTNTQKSKKIEGLVQPHQSTASLIVLILDHIKEDQRANVGSTCTICECQSGVLCTYCTPVYNYSDISSKKPQYCNSVVHIWLCYTAVKVESLQTCMMVVHEQTRKGGWGLSRGLASRELSL